MKSGPGRPWAANGPGSEALTLPEELLALALDRERGRQLGSGSYLRYGVAGAALAELELAGRIAGERGGRIVVLSPLPVGDAVLDAALAALPGPGKGRGPKAQRWVRGPGRVVLERCWERLEERGAVRREVRRALGIFRYVRHPAGPVDLTGPARARFKAALEAGLPDRRSRALAALVSAADLAPRLLPGRPQWPARRGLRRLVGQEWTALAVRRAVQQDKSAGSGGDGGGGD